MSHPSVHSAVPLVVFCLAALPATGVSATDSQQSIEADARQARLGPGDQIRVDVVDLPELAEREAAIGADGALSLPHVGRLRAEGLTAGELEEQIELKLSEVMYDPQAAVSVIESASRPVYVLGAVGEPGALQMRGDMRLLEALSLAGGLGEDSGHALTVTRRLDHGVLDHPDAAVDAVGGFSTVEIPLAPLVTSQDPRSNLTLMPDDVVSVREADLVYVVGQVERAGGFVLKERERVTTLKALALAGGLRPHAAVKRAKILRRENKDTEAEEVPVDLKAILEGSAEDIPLSPEDVLFIPKSGAKSASAKAADTVLSTLSGILIWRR